MSEMEEKLGAILNNPQMMQQIMTLAQSLGAGPQDTKPQTAPEPKPPQLPDLDPKLLQSLGGLLNRGMVDREQQTLLHALSPYLSRDRIVRLERAMQAARMAGAASAFLGAGGLQMLSGR